MESTIARFLDGLYKDIYNKVYMYPSYDIEDLLHIAVKI